MMNKFDIILHLSNDTNIYFLKMYKFLNIQILNFIYKF